jgi:hypothetical protein
MTARCTSSRYTRRSQSGPCVSRVAIVQWESETKTKSCGTGLVRTPTIPGSSRSDGVDPNPRSEPTPRQGMQGPACGAGMNYLSPTAVRAPAPSRANATFRPTTRGSSASSFGNKGMSEFTLLDTQQLETLLERAQERLFSYGVGFVKVGATPGAEPILAGSGTLVVIGGVYGILTADHVLENLPPTGRVGLTFGRYPQGPVHRFTIAMDVASRFIIAKASGNESGPDLGFLALPPDAVSALKARASFYEVVSRRTRILSSPPAIESGGWIILGVVDEWSISGPGESGFKGVKHFTTVCGGSAVSHEEQRDGFDYLYFEVKCSDPEQNRPTSFKGTSGGSLWQLVAQLGVTGGVKARKSGEVRRARIAPEQLDMITCCPHAG